MAFDTWRDDGEFAIKATDVLKNYQEGGELGVCEVHGCEIIGSKKSVLSYPKNEKGELIGEPYLYDARVCPMCHAEGIKTVATKAVNDFLGEFKAKKGIDLTKNVIVKYDFADELSVVSCDNMVKWIVTNVGRQKKVKRLKVRKYIHISENRFSSDEAREKYLKILHDIEEAEILIFDSLADFTANQAEKALTPLLSASDNCSIIILTIPESDERLEQLPARLKFKLNNAQVMNFSSTGQQR